jgi:hypothetical protein
MRPSSAWGCKTSPRSITRRVACCPNASRPRSGQHDSEQCGWGRRWGDRQQTASAQVSAPPLLAPRPRRYRMRVALDLGSHSKITLGLIG